jgi:hypothetical protein
MRISALTLAVAVALAGCTASPIPSVSPTAIPSVAPSRSASADAPVVLAAGDIAGCDLDGDEATADLLDELDGAVLTLGDNAYPDGTAENFADCYDPSWGRHRERTHPSAGNHEYDTPDASAYFAYFGERAGARGEGWYSFDLGAWHIVALNSNCDEVGGCDGSSPQAAWLRADLQAHPAACTLAYWHHSRWSSGDAHGSDDRTDSLWRILHDAGADLVLSGHDHAYERFVPMDADGAASTEGMTAFVVGTGGRRLYAFGQILPTSATRDNANLGVLRLTLRADRYEWEFVSVSTTTFSDAGSAGCR